MNAITIIGFTVLFYYSITQILNFYGIGEETYGIYLVFYIFIVISVLVLPNDYPSI